MSEDRFEKNVLLVIGFIGLARAVFSIIYDLTTHEQNDLVIDILFGLLFLGTILSVSYLASFRWLLLCFYLPFICLLLGSFILNKGLEGSTEHNFFVGFVVICFTLRGKNLIFICLLYILGIIGSIAYLDIQYSFYDSFQNSSRSNLNFIIAAIGMIGFTYYAKNVLINRRRKLKENAEYLKTKNAELTVKTTDLERQKIALEDITRELDEKAISRMMAIKNQQNKREEYISITLTDLSEKSQDTVTTIKKLEGKEDEEELISMLNQCADKLIEEMDLLKRKVNGNY